MSYQVLARKWRPLSFASLVGQEHVVRALTHALETGRLHHAWLFTGTRGVGKTTISRILAKALNCESGVTATPCGTCEACLAIDADRFPDYVEMDAASNRGVDDMAALLDRAAYVPVQGRYKVYMIDEVHMLTGHAFNAMLKTLEEPPEHVKFILATTDPQKIPVTVLSRCLQFNLKQMPRAAICEHLAHILQAEGVPFEAPALTHLAHGANGSMRDALSLLDQAIAHGAGRVEQKPVMLMLGTVGDDHLIELLTALAAEEVDRLLAVAADMAARTLSFDAALQALAAMLHRVALLQFAPAGLDEAERARLEPFAEAFDAEFLQLAYQIVIHGRGDLPLAPDEYTGFTMTLLRLLAFRPENMPPGRRRPLPSEGAAAEAATSPEAASHSDAPTAAAPQVEQRVERVQGMDAPPPRAESGNVTPAAAPRDAAPEAGVPPWEDVPPWEELPEAPPMAAAREERPPAGEDTTDTAFGAQPALQPTAAAESPPPTDERSRTDASALIALCDAGDWRGVIAMVSPDGLVRELCQHCEWIGREDGVLRLRLSAAQRHVLELNPDLPERLAQCFAAHGDAVRVQIEVGEIEAGTPAQAVAAERQQRHRTALAALEQDPFVREVIQRFDAALIEASIQPLPNNTSGDAR